MTKTDTRRELTPQQEAAADLLAAGRTISDTAAAIGVARQTVSEWLNQSYRFQAELGRRRGELWVGATDRLRALLPKALEVIEQGLQVGSVSAALGVLKAAGLHGIGAPDGPTTAEDAELDAREHADARTHREFRARLGQI